MGNYTAIANPNSKNAAKSRPEYPSVASVELFAVLSKTLSMSKAARALRCSQPTVSTQLARLEKIVGGRLFERTNRGLLLTDRGHALVPKAVDLLSVVKDFAAVQVVEPEDLPLRIGAIEPVGSHYLPSILGHYQRNQRFPISFELHSGTTSSLTRAIRDGTLHFAVVAAPARADGLDFTPLRYEPVALLVPKSHRLAREGNATLRRLAEERLILTDDGCDFRRMLQREFDRLRCLPERVTTISTIEGIVDSVRAGLGVAILPLCALARVPHGTAVVHVEKSALRLRVGICARMSLRETEAQTALAFIAAQLKG